MSKIKWQLGKVTWYNEVSGEGMVKGENGQNYHVQGSAIEAGQKSLKKNQRVKIQVPSDKFAKHVTKLISD